MSIRYMVIFAAGLIITGNVLAEDGSTLAKKSNCLNCHDVDKKKIGPSYKEVANKYKDDKFAQATLEKKVRSGGGGVWGKMPMPATAKTVADEDIKTLVQWILSIK